MDSIYSQKTIAKYLQMPYILCDLHNLTIVLHSRQDGGAEQQRQSLVSISKKSHLQVTHKYFPATDRIS